MLLALQLSFFFFLRGPVTLHFAMLPLCGVILDLGLPLRRFQCTSLCITIILLGGVSPKSVLKM